MKKGLRETLENGFCSKKEAGVCIFYVYVRKRGEKAV